MKKWITGTFLWFYSFFTVWGLCLFFGIYFNILPSYLSNSVKAALILSSVGGFYITFIKPKMLHIPFFPIPITVKGIPLIIADLLTHHLPTVYALLYFPNEGNLTPFAILTLIYIILNDPTHHYLIEPFDFLIIISIAITLQCFLLKEIVV